MQQERKPEDLHRDLDEAEDKSRHGQYRTEFTIVVNGRKRPIEKREYLTFRQLVALAFDDPPTGEFICFSITYRRGHRDNPEGHLAEGESVKLRDGMIFNVTVTDKS